MFCKNCGKENENGSLSCKFCGQDFTKTVSENISGEPTGNITTTNKLRINKILIVGIIVIFVLLFSCVLFFMFRTSTPDIEQLKKDFVEEILENKEYSITEFKIISETDGKNDEYKAITEIVYDDTDIEYHRQYEFIYNKYKEWVLVDICAYDKESWQTLPIAVPSASDYTEECEEYLKIENEYDHFSPVESKTTADLDSGKATFVFSVEKDTAIQDISGEIEFYFSFNEESGEWEMSDYAYADSYSVQYDLINTWSGDGYPYLLTESEDNKVNFVFEITKYENEIVEGVLKYDGKSYILSGTLSDTSGEYVVLKLSNENEKKSISLSLQYDGNATADIDTQYIPDQIVYFGYMKSQYKDVEMTLK